RGAEHEHPHQADVRRRPRPRAAFPLKSPPVTASGGGGGVLPWAPPRRPPPGPPRAPRDLSLALRLHALDTGPPEQAPPPPAPALGRLCGGPVEEAGKGAGGARRLGGGATAERGGGGGVLPLDPYLRRVGEGAGAVCLVARKGGHGEGASGWPGVGPPSRPSR